MGNSNDGADTVRPLTVDSRLSASVSSLASARAGRDIRGKNVPGLCRAGFKYAT